jgi:hypothetical protein
MNGAWGATLRLPSRQRFCVMWPWLPPLSVSRRLPPTSIDSVSRTIDLFRTSLSPRSGHWSLGSRENLQRRAIIAPVFKLRHLGRLTNCREASRLISQAQEHRLSASDWVRLRLHICWCVACQRVEAQMSFLRRAMQRYRD